MRQHLYVDNVDLATYGVFISGDGTFTAPEKEHTFFNVPGRNGDLVSSIKRLQDIEVSYKCFICANLDTNIEALRNFLLSRNGRVKISDTYHTAEYRMGVYQGPFEPTLVKTLDAGSFVLTFRCQPQRWLVSGDTPITYTRKSGSGRYTITNSTQFYAKPLWRFIMEAGYTNGHLDFTPDCNINIIGLDSPYVDIDSETMEVTYNGENKSSFVRIWSSANGNPIIDPPTLRPGTTYMYFNTQGYPYNGIEKIEMTPRWWML